MTASVAPAARRAANSSAMEGLARFGLVAYAAVYLLIGILALLLAFGDNAGETDQNGAMQQLSQQTGGFVLLLILGLGLVGYALWRLTEAVFGVAVDGKKAGPRIAALASGISYGLLAVTAFTILVQGRTSDQVKQQQSLTARFMHHTAGRWLVGLVGIAIVIGGLVLAYRGIARKFERYFKLDEMSAAARKTTVVLGVVGSAARGVVFAMIGVLILIAAVQYDPRKARGLDGALHSFRATPLGPSLLVVVALGLLMFGLFALFAARWRRVT